MTTVAQYNGTAQHILAKGADGLALKFELLSNSALFNAAHTTRSQVNNTLAYAISGNGWPAGGAALVGLVSTAVTTNDAILDANDISVVAAGGTIGPAYKGVIYDDNDPSDKPLFFFDFEGAKQAENGTNFQVQMSADGLVKLND